MTPDELFGPLKWPVGRIGDVANVQSGFAFKSEWYTTEGVRLLRNANVHQCRLDWTDGVCLPLARMAEFADFELSAGDIVLALDRPLVAAGLKVAQLTNDDLPALLVQRVGLFRLNGDVAPEFLFAFLNSPFFIRQIVGHDQSLGVPHVSPKQVEAVRIPLPPLGEQRRIAGILKEQMEAVERARVAAEAQLEAAKALPAAFLRDVFNSNDAQTWPSFSLGDVLKVKSGEFLPAKKMVLSGTHPVYGGNGINGSHDTYIFDEPQLVIGRVGAHCGCIHITAPQCWITDNALYVSEQLVPFDNEFMAFALTLLDLNSKASSMAQPLVTGKLIYSQEVQLPPIETQRSLARHLRDKTTQSIDLVDRVEAHLKEINALPAALLRQAFTGAL